MKLLYPNASAARSATSRFEGRLREALCSEVARRSRAPAASLDDRRGPGRLRLEPTDRDLGRVAGNAMALEVVGDQQIARAAAGEKRRPARGEPLIVDEPRPLHRLYRRLVARRARCHGRRAAARGTPSCGRGLGARATLPSASRRRSSRRRPRAAARSSATADSQARRA